ncbi:MAG: tRNA (adenosine(37)-N6)-threonylcarbamoyltransferase complex dimerization subunit type 1 TsaB [Bryobacteraceae bacterium]
MSRRILAIDTTGEFGSLALLEDGQVIEEVSLHSAEGFGHVLFLEIEALLARHHVGLDAIDLFASASGPGSFTGVRVGLTAVKGLAEATSRKVVAISNLQALAWFGTRPLRATVLDARRGEVFGAVYDADLREVCAEVVLPFPAWLATLPADDIEFITSGYLLNGVEHAPIVEAPRALAAAIGKIAMMHSGEDPAAIDANYVRRSDAELMWKD